MDCVKCKYPDSQVIRTEHVDRPPNTILRRRECLRCGQRWSTQEKIKDPKQKRIEINHA